MKRSHGIAVAIIVNNKAGGGGVACWENSSDIELIMKRNRKMP